MKNKVVFRPCRVWTKNVNGKVEILTDWQTWGQCRRFIIARWGHWPPFAFISSIKETKKFKNRYGD